MTRLPGGLARPALIGLAALIVLVVVGAFLAPVLLFAGGGIMFSTGSACASGTVTTAQPPVSTQASDSIPANYLSLFKSIGAQYKVPWVVLAGIGKIEIDARHDRLSLWIAEPAIELEDLRTGGREHQAEVEEPAVHHSVGLQPAHRRLDDLFHDRFTHRIGQQFVC